MNLSKYKPFSCSMKQRYLYTNVYPLQENKIRGLNL